MGSATAQVIVHTLDDFCFRGVWFSEKQAVGAQDHSRSTKAALEGIVVHKGFLERVETSTPEQPFNSDDFLSFDLSHRKLARTDCLVVDQDGTRSADTLSAAIFRSREAKVRTQDPQKLSISINRHHRWFTIELEPDRFKHIR
ncbi:MAG: hypothetical protein H6Q41_4144, partial [Deltaproteobacteria bacterium]|nr:hypothetical protein [Deltaproteobacteria bacterium]